jgi:hypothetical protein
MLVYIKPGGFMEDHKQSRTKPAADKEEKILDLTKDMELADQAKHKIFDLTDDGAAISEEHLPEEQPISPPPPITESETEKGAPSIVDEPEKDPLQRAASDTSLQPDSVPAEDELTADDIGTLSEAESAEMEPPSLDATVLQEKSAGQPENGSQESEPELDLDEGAETQETPEDSEAAAAPPSIEEEVDAAFDEVQFDQSPKDSEEKKGDRLFDKLSGITQMVDDAVRQINKDDTSQPAPSSSDDDITLESEAADIEAAISDGDEDEEIIELTDVVDPSEIMADEDDDIIDLVDIVDPAELESGTWNNESTVIASETADQIDGEPEASALMEQDALPEPESDTKPLDRPATEAEELVLSDLDDLDLDEDIEKDIDLPDDFDTPEIDELFSEEDLEDEEAFSEAGEQIVEPDSDHEEDVILLTDVLRKGDSAEKKMTADARQEEETAKEFESEDDMASDTLDSVSLPPDAKERDVLLEHDIETAVEHLLKTKYADTIQRMVAEAVEKAVTREVENIKRGLSARDTP